MDDLSRFCGQNPDCSKYALRGEGNLSVCSRYGKDNQCRMLHCNRAPDDAVDHHR